MRIVPRLPYRLLGKLAIAYSIQVIVFAVAYFVLPPGSFYQSSLTAEPSFRRGLDREGERLKVLLEPPIRATLRSRTDSVEARQFASWHLAGVALRPVPEENHLSARLAYRPNDSGEVGGLQTLAQVADVRLAVENQGGKAYIFLFRSGDTRLEKALFERSNYVIPAQDADLQEAVQALEELIAQQSGILPKNFDTFLKLLYFSAVTAATVGYGDIVPARKLSRLFATVQAVVSIVMLSYYVGRVVSDSDRTANQKTVQ